ncbi:zinc finger, CCHC-type containing protein [Tanacetum coccineum]
MVYFSAIPRDGIFEIDLSNSYANESSIYTVSNKRAKLDLDSALLWHCRLGHISKKHIEKLQHDGILNSTDLRAFEKCIPCMENSLITQKESGSLKDLEIIQEEDTHPSIDTSLNHEDDDLEIDEPHSDIIRIRRSTRIRRPTDRVCLYIDAEENELGDLGEPANYKAALLDPESDKWLNAMNVEFNP